MCVCVTNSILLTFMGNTGDPLSVPSQKRSSSVHTDGPIPLENVSLCVHPPPPAHGTQSPSSGGVGAGWEGGEGVTRWRGGSALLGPSGSLEIRKLIVSLLPTQLQPSKDFFMQKSNIFSNIIMYILYTYIT